MPVIRKGHSIVIDDLRFDFAGKMIHVYGLPRHNLVASFSVVDKAGWSRVRTEEDFQMQVMWWLNDNDHSGRYHNAQV